MKLADLFEHLSYGVLAQLNISGNDTGIKNRDFPKITSHINLGLTSLYTRFPLRKDEIQVQLNSGIETYYLRNQYASSNVASAEPIKYLLDTVGSPFGNNVLRIEAIYNDEDEELVLNDEHTDTTIWTPNFDTFKVQEPVDGDVLLVSYRANHEKLVVTAATDADSVEIILPEYLLEALSLFVASKVVNPIGKEGPALANNYFVQYETMLRNIEMAGMVNKELHAYDALKENGWV